MATTLAYSRASSKEYFAYVVSLTYEVLTKPGSREVMLYVGFEPTLVLKTRRLWPLDEYSLWWTLLAGDQYLFRYERSTLTS